MEPIVITKLGIIENDSIIHNALSLISTKIPNSLSEKNEKHNELRIKH